MRIENAAKHRDWHRVPQRACPLFSRSRSAQQTVAIPYFPPSIYTKTVLQVASILFLALFISISVIIPACSQEDDEAILLEYSFEDGDTYNYSLELNQSATISEFTTITDQDSDIVSETEYNADFEYDLEMYYAMIVNSVQNNLIDMHFSIRQVYLDGYDSNKDKDDVTFCFPRQYCTNIYDDSIIGIVFDSGGSINKISKLNDSSQQKHLQLIGASNRKSYSLKEIKEIVTFIERQMRFQNGTIFIRLFDVMFPTFSDNMIQEKDMWDKKPFLFAEGFGSIDSRSHKWINKFYYLNDFQPNKSIKFSFVGFEEFGGIECAVIHASYNENLSKMANNLVDDFSFIITYDAKMYFDYTRGIPISIEFEINHKSRFISNTKHAYDIQSKNFQYPLGGQKSQPLNNKWQLTHIEYFADMAINGTIDIQLDE